MIKHIILILLLSAVSFAQIYERKNIEVVRANDRTLIFTYNEDLSNDTLLFVVKATRSISSPRLIQKESTDITEMKISYFANVSMIEIYLQSQDTEDRDTARHWYDITRVHNGDSTTLFLGWFDIWSNVATRFDGTNLPGGVRITTVALDNGTVNNELITWDDQEGKWKPASTTIENTVGEVVGDSLAKLKITNVPFLFSVIKENPSSTNAILFKSNESFKIDSVVGVVDAGSLLFNIKFGSIASPDSVFNSATLSSTTGQSFTSFLNDTITTNDWVLFTTRNESGVNKATVVVYYTPLVGVTAVRTGADGYQDSYVMDNKIIDFFNGGKNVLKYNDSTANNIFSDTFTPGTGFEIDSTYTHSYLFDAFRIRYNSGEAFPKFVSAFNRNNVLLYAGDPNISNDEEGNATISFWIDRTELNGNGIVFCDIGGGTHIISGTNLAVEGYESNYFGTKLFKVLKVDGNYSCIEFFAYRYIFDNKILFRISIYNSSSNDVNSLTIFNPTLIYNKKIDPYYRYKSVSEKNNSRFIGKKILLVGDSQFNDGQASYTLANLTGATIVDAHEGGHRMAYSSTSWFYEWYNKRSQTFSWTDIDYYLLPISSNDNGGGNTRQSAIDSVEYYYPYFGDDNSTITTKMSRFNSLSESDKAAIFGYKQTYIAFVKQLLKINPEAKIIIGSIPIGCGSESMTGSVDINGYGIWKAGFSANERRSTLTPLLTTKRNDIIEVANYFNANFLDLFNQVGLTFDNYHVYCKDGVHWDLQNSEIKKRIGYAAYQELLKVK